MPRSATRACGRVNPTSFIEYLCTGQQRRGVVLMRPQLSLSCCTYGSSLRTIRSYCYFFYTFNLSTITRRNALCEPALLQAALECTRAHAGRSAPPPRNPFAIGSEQQHCVEFWVRFCLQCRRCECSECDRRMLSGVDLRALEMLPTPPEALLLR